MHPYKIGRGTFRRVHEYFSMKADVQDLRSEIRKDVLLHKAPPLTDFQKKEVRDYFGHFGLRNICLDWHRLATFISGRFYKDYMPQDLFYTIIEPKLNMFQMFGITDKNLTDKVLPNTLMPKSVVKCVNGVLYDGLKNEIITRNKVEVILNKYSKLIIKPSIDSYGGKNIIVFNLHRGVTDYQKKSIEELMSSYGKHFVIQEFIEQNESLNRLNRSSVNSMRMRSIFINNKIEILPGALRVGREGSFVDNTSQGGFHCGISDSGILRPYGYDGKRNVISETDSGVKFNGFIIPNFNKVLQLIKESHTQLPHFRMISWDIAINKNGEPVLIEYNVKGQGFSQEYGPLFGSYTDEVMKWCFGKS